MEELSCLWALITIVLKKMKKSSKLDDIPYQDFHQALFSIHHVSSEAPWLKHKKPVIEIDNNFSNIELKEKDETINVEISKSSINPLLYIIDVNNTRAFPENTNFFFGGIILPQSLKTKLTSYGFFIPLFFNLFVEVIKKFLFLQKKLCTKLAS